VESAARLPRVGYQARVVELCSSDGVENRLTVSPDIIKSKIKTRVDSQTLDSLCMRMSRHQAKGLKRKAGTVGVSVGQKFGIVKRAIASFRDGIFFIFNCVSRSYCRIPGI
jgi:hypothetical protein